MDIVPTRQYSRTRVYNPTTKATISQKPERINVDTTKKPSFDEVMLALDVALKRSKTKRDKDNKKVAEKPRKALFMSEYPVMTKHFTKANDLPAKIDSKINSGKRKAESIVEFATSSKKIKLTPCAQDHQRLKDNGKRQKPRLSIRDRILKGATKLKPNAVSQQPVQQVRRNMNEIKQKLAAIAERQRKKQAELEATSSLVIKGEYTIKTVHIPEETNQRSAISRSQLLKDLELSSSDED